MQTFGVRRATRSVLSTAILFGLLLVASGCARKPLQMQELHGSTLATMKDVDEIEPIDDPELMTMDAAAASMRSDEPVLGFEVDGHPVAVALSLLDEHEIVNLEPAPGETPVAATW